ncbi:GltB/FmdC/FwdC-like GXGXG domain-containing protein [Youxingia wuxianensis]|uniref:Glutamate synthase n=1 Tax=Youxingia wuxianensis TaxID=2763678 RepID=A0A926EL93_9FIRM|nr:glutamate synthase [Youxingia wuxianensis]MBC8585483.1 glutamate synthase [Youxingia wuxianensis]
MKIEARNMHFKDLNEAVRHTSDTNIEIDQCLGQRYIASGLGGKSITINGIPGNALGSYLNGADIVVNGNAQDATGDTMNEGHIYIHGSCGDATGYGMRGGKIYIRGSAGYRAGIHMKAYKDKLPVIVIGGSAGSFLGEYQAGGIIIVLGLDREDSSAPVGRFCGTGMHGGKIFLCCDNVPDDLPGQIIVHKAKREELGEIEHYISEYCAHFGGEEERILSKNFYILSPNSKNPYKQLYTYN